MKTKKNLLMVLTLSVVAGNAAAQTNGASFGREEYITVAENVRLHVTELGEGKPVVLIHGWPLSDAMYE